MGRLTIYLHLSGFFNIPFFMRGFYIAYWVLLSLILQSVAFGSAPDCSRTQGSLPRPNAPAGTSDPNNPIEHILIVMQENRSFDEYLGRLNSAGYEGQVDGVTPEMSNPDKDGKPVFAYHENSLCVYDTDHSWNAAHLAWNQGKGDGFVRSNAPFVMGYYEKDDLPYYYALANRFAIGDRYFSSVLSPTYPNRYYLYAGTSFGHTGNIEPAGPNHYSQKTIFDVLNEHKITWKYYSSSKGYIYLFQPMYLSNLDKMKGIMDYHEDLARNRLPQVVFLESSDFLQDEHAPANIHIGQEWVARRIDALMNSNYWAKSVLFLTYDENGGMFDHVTPPLACAPDDIEPILPVGGPPTTYPNHFKTYGFRVPLIVVSPYVKRHFVSHQIYDHTSILKFIETKFNLPALTRRDANANDMYDFFDFSKADLDTGKLPRVSPRFDQWMGCLFKGLWSLF